MKKSRSFLGLGLLSIVAFLLGLAASGCTIRPQQIVPQGDGSTLDADMVDGKHASEFVTEAVSPSQIAPQGDGSLLDADSVDGLHASASPQPNHIVSLNKHGQFPPSVIPVSSLKVYDSGWFHWNYTTERTREIVHSLGTTKLLINCYYSSTSDGSNDVHQLSDLFIFSRGAGGYCRNITDTSLQFYVGEDALFVLDELGKQEKILSGYARVVILALE